MNLFCTALFLFADLLVGTWNLRWFPSGRAEHRASAEQEAKTTEQAAETIRDGLARRAPDDSVILFLQELRSEAACSNLVARIGATNGVSLASISTFRNYDGRLGWQQVAIVSDLPVVERSWATWRRTKKEVQVPRFSYLPFLGTQTKSVPLQPPRGYAYALLDAGGKDGLIACYCVHLKSNYGATTDEAKADNRAKREAAAAQLAAVTKKIRSPDGRRVSRMIVAGDFNTDVYAADFAAERTIPILAEAGYRNCFEGCPTEARGTRPGGKTFAASTLDYVFSRGFSAQAEPWLAPRGAVSDHRMVWTKLKE